MLFYIQGDARIGLIKSPPESIYLKTCSTSSERLIPGLHPELLSGGVESQWLQQLVM